jgi:serine/threonine protein kinase
MHDDLPPLGSTVGPWRILTRLDSGSFGVVYRAQRAGHPDSPPVALKVARRPKDPRFEREAELLRLAIPGAPRFEDEGLWTAPSGQRYPYVVMELVEGFTPYDWFQGDRTSREVLEVLAQVAGALTFAHARGAVHRDVKGDNIRVTPEGRAVLLDWGSGWFASARPLTDTTAPPGTTPYRPPEQKLFSWRFRKDLEARWQAQPTDDLYSLGVALYRCVTGVYLPSMSEGGEVVVRKVPKPSGSCTVSLELEALILRLLSADREQRGTAEALARDTAVLAETAGESVDRPILPTASAVPTDSGSPSSDGLDDEVLSETDTGRSGSSNTNSTSTGEGRRPRQEVQLPPWLPLAGAALVGGMLVFLGWEMHRTASEQNPAPQPWIATPEEVAQFAPGAGVGEDALSGVQDMPRAIVPLVMTVGKPMPKKPPEGQKRPPCGPGQISVNGACWAGPIEGQKPPCGQGMFDYEGKCYFAVYDAPRPPASEEP